MNDQDRDDLAQLRAALEECAIDLVEALARDPGAQDEAIETLEARAALDVACEEFVFQLARLALRGGT